MCGKPVLKLAEPRTFEQTSASRRAWQRSRYTPREVVGRRHPAWGRRTVGRSWVQTIRRAFPVPTQMVGTGHAFLRCGRDPSLLGGRDHGPSGPKRPSASLGTPLLERGMCGKTRHFCVRVLRTHPYRGGSRIFAMIFATRADERREPRVFEGDRTALKRRVGRRRRFKEPSGGASGNPAEATGFT